MAVVIPRPELEIRDHRATENYGSSGDFVTITIVPTARGSHRRRELVVMATSSSPA
ncbi:hypothetical protein TIFTF001_019889 [Ficus carica]|uniref:Uncharacterized protein n=1 Tax=Ficus carica TaxID=3494 RepID=A0AA88DD81_FICCA|nr:hypothetical protein TIFTF001_019889 [Ficus carica]